MPRRLTIAIPTYNRPEPLRRTLLALRPQANEDVELVVVDNASTPPVEPVVNEVMAGSAWAFRVIRNAANIGMCANILRCFEVANTDWLWALSDDDAVDPAAIETILGIVQKHPELLYATCSIPALPITSDRICESVDAFFQALDSIPRIIFISSSIYHRQRLIPYLSLAYNFIDSGSPHTALLQLAGLAQPQQPMAFLSREIASWQPPAPEDTYSKFQAISQHRLLALSHGATRAHLARLLVKDTPSPVRLLLHLLRDAAHGRKRELLQTILTEYFDAYGKTRGGVTGAFWRGPARLAGQLALHFAGATKALAEFAFRLLRGKPLSYDPNPVSLNSYLRLSETKREQTTIR
jgi:glycosyltransferase involved in cell wall biosynthesis